MFFFIESCAQASKKTDGVVVCYGRRIEYWPATLVFLFCIDDGGRAFYTSSPCPPTPPPSTLWAWSRVQRLPYEIVESRHLQRLCLKGGGRTSLRETPTAWTLLPIFRSFNHYCLKSIRCTILELMCFILTKVQRIYSNSCSNIASKISNF